MDVKIDYRLLNEQIKMCDIRSDNASSEEEREIFEGSANLLSEISFATETGQEVNFVKVN